MARVNGNTILELLQNGKTQKEIAEITKLKSNAVYAAVRRLRQKGVWKDTEAPIKIVEQKEITPDDLLNALLKKVERTDSLEVENEVFKKENYELKNINAALKNELEIKKEELKNRPEQTERINKLAAKLHSEQMKLSQEAQR